MVVRVLLLLVVRLLVIWLLVIWLLMYRVILAVGVREDLQTSLPDVDCGSDASGLQGQRAF